MSFGSFAFIFRFLPIFLIVYYICPEKYRNVVFFIGNLIFYSFGNLSFLPLLAASAVIHYAMGKQMQKQNKKKVLLILTLLYDFGVLFYFKTIGSSYGLPLGISFYTFQMSAYIIDVYMGKYEPEDSFLKLACYCTMFTQIQSGPIVNYAEVREDLSAPKFNTDNLEQGFRLFIIGLGAKIILADRMGLLWNQLEMIGYENISTTMAWVGAFAYTMQLYFDFSGYSMMAMGIAKMFGFHLPVNFHFPYMSLSVGEFWRRWHITLGRWFRNYIYIPLGGNRKGEVITVRNLFAVWIFTAIWHGIGWNFVIWGMILFLMISIEKKGLLKILETYKWIGHLYIVLLMPLTWVVFAIRDLGQLAIYFGKLFPFFTQAIGTVNPQDYASLLQNGWYLFILCFAFCTPYPQKLYEKIKEQWLGGILLIGVFVIGLYYMAFSVNNPFMYISF